MLISDLIDKREGRCRYVMFGRLDWIGWAVYGEACHWKPVSELAWPSSRQVMGARGAARQPANRQISEDDS